MTGSRGLGPQGGALDLVAVARDDAMLDLLAARVRPAGDDPLAGLLAAFAAEVDEGLDVFLVPEPAAPTGLRAVPDAAVATVVPGRAARRGLGRRAGTVAVVVAATLSVSGVAAAVTGDPLAAYKGVASAFHGARGGNDGPSTHAARVAQLNHRLNGTSARIAHGDLGAAQSDLAALRAELAKGNLSKGERTALEARIAALQARLVRATATAEAREAHQKSQGPGSKASAAPKHTRAGPQSTRTPEPRTSQGTGAKVDKPARPKPAKTAAAGSTDSTAGTGTAATADPVVPDLAPTDGTTATTTHGKSGTARGAAAGGAASTGNAAGAGAQKSTGKAH